MTYTKIYIPDEDMKALLDSYPFLKYDVDKQTVAEAIDHNYYKYWDGSGWEELWKVKYMPRLFEEYRNMTDEDKKNFRILDTKEKYGTLRVYTNKKSECDLETVAEWISECTCELCGSEPRTIDGYREIWRTNSWIMNMCKGCATKQLLENGVKIKDINKKLDEMHVVYDEPFAYEKYSNGKMSRYMFKETPDGWLEKDSVINEHKGE